MRTSRQHLRGERLTQPWERHETADRTVLARVGGGDAGLPHAGSTPRPSHEGYRHEAFFWRGDEEFLAGMVPFIAEGVEAGQPVMVAVHPHRIELLREALGAAAQRVEFVDMTQLGANPARIIPAWRDFSDTHAATGQAVRGVGEPIWHGRRATELAECQLHEALLNIAVDPDTPLWLVCPYDAGTLSEEVLAEAHRSHPVVVDGALYRGSTAYRGLDHVETTFASDLAVSDVVASRRFFGPGELASLRAETEARASAAGLGEERCADLALAVHEVAVNSCEHGGGGGELRIWEDAGALVCEVRDSGLIADPLVGRRLPSWDEDGGRGLWLVNQLCDLVQIRSGDTGTTVRLHVWLQSAPT